MIARIYTEDKNRQSIYDIIEVAGFLGFTLFETTGSWNGKLEKSIVVEIVCYGGDEEKDKIRWIAGRINRVNKQEATLIVFDDTPQDFLISLKVQRGGEYIENS